MNLYLQLALIIQLLIIFPNTNAFCQNWSWATATGSTSMDAGVAVSTDISGNIYIVGEFMSSTINFGSFTLTNAGKLDMFVAKYDPSGNVLWAKNISDSMDEKATSVSTDDSGNVYVTGYFEDDTLFIGNDTLINKGFNSKELLIVKYDEDGNLIWAKGAGGRSNDIIYSIKTSQSGEVFIAGTYVSDTLFMDSVLIFNSGDYDIFIAKLNSNGDVLWAKTTGGINADYAYDVDIDATGIYLAGYFYSSTINFGSTTLTNSATQSDLFVAKYDQNGNNIWATGAGGIGQENAYSIAHDSSGNIYVAGHFSSSNLVVGTTTLTNVGTSFNIFLSKFDSSGIPIWAKGFGQNGIDVATSLEYNSDVLCLTGYFNNPSITFGSTTLLNVGENDMFLSAFDSSGNSLWTKSIGGTSEDVARSVAIDHLGNTYVTGYFKDTVSIGASNFISAGGTDIFLAKVDDINTAISTLEKLEADLNIFPNPFHKCAKLILPENLLQPFIFIYDFSGRCVQSYLFEQNSHIQKNNLPPGMYLFKVIDGSNFIGSGKMIVE
jgi:hypothetical protein